MFSFTVYAQSCIEIIWSKLDDWHQCWEGAAHFDQRAKKQGNYKVHN